jgi:superfamily I DNA and RNA helicase
MVGSSSYLDEYTLAKYLLEKYADIINEREERTIGEIKDLVSGNDLSVQALVEEFKEKPYSFKENYEKAARELFEYIKKEITYVDSDINVNYWLTPREVLEAKIADDEDMSVFLCSCLKALGDEKAEVIIAELENLKTHAFVITEIDSKFLILDPAQKHSFDEFFGDKTAVLKKYSFDKQQIRRFLYRFNYSKYEQFLE